MKIPRWTLRVAALVLGVAGGSTIVKAQGITTAAISGTVRDVSNAPLENATVTVLNRSNGRTTVGRTHSDGQYLIQGLEVGGPYSVSVRRLGSEGQKRDSIMLALGQNFRVDFSLATTTTQLAAVTSSASVEGATISRSHTGVATQISDSTIRRMPSPNRDFADFAALTPQVATSGNGTGNGLSAAGMNTRFNTIQIDGANNTDLYAIASGNNSEPGSAAGAKAISIEAVKEYQVLLSPFDVRQGNFAGLLLNAITRSGTNEFHGSGFYYDRNHGLERDAFPNGTPLGKFDQRQYGFSLGGPIVKDRAFFFIAPEFQAQKLPSSGTYVGAADSPVSQGSIDAFNSELTKYGIEGGTGEAVQKDQPNTNIFARVDVNLTNSTRLVARYNYVDAKQTSFSRSPSGAQPTFALTSNVFATTNKTSSPVLQLLSNFSNGIYNELQYSRTDIRDFRTVPLVSPQITVTVPNALSTTGTARLVAGEEASSHCNAISQTTTELVENVTLPWRDHAFTVGTKLQFYHPNNLFANNLNGAWSFNSLDSLSGTCATCGGVPVPATYAASIPVNPGETGGAGIADARTFSYYAQDQWQATRDLSVTAGLRVDIPWFVQSPADNTAFANSSNVINNVTVADVGLTGRSTTFVPNKQKQWAPRVGFNWDIGGTQTNQLRGGVGVFTGAPPYVFLINAFSNTGLYGFASLSCSGTTSTTAPPAFNAANLATPPDHCGTAGSAPALSSSSALNTIDPSFRFPSSWKSSLGYDHRFSNDSWGWLKGSVATFEGLFTHAINAPFYQNLALAGPDSIHARNLACTPQPTCQIAETDRFGRVLYGTFTSGTGSNAIIRNNASRTAVYDVSNSNKDWSYALTTQLQKRFTSNFEGSVAYTYSQARDVQSIINSTAASAFNQGRDVSGRHDVQNLARSHWEQPHRVVASGTWTVMNTDISATYMGGTGSTYDFTYSGDINADGRSGNDLVYVPKDVRDPNEIVFTGWNSTTHSYPLTALSSVAAQQAGLDQFINETPCLRNQRGRIMDRNSCRAPWINLTNVSLRHSVPTGRGERAQLQLDIFNFANLLNDKWGLNRQVLDGGLTGAFLMSRSGTDLNYPGGAQHIFTYNTANTNYDANRVASVYHLQLSLRYSF
jgi:hypothetical protein